MKGVTKAALYMRLSKDDEQFGDSISIETQDEICQGYFLPQNTKNRKMNTLVLLLLFWYRSARALKCCTLSKSKVPSSL